MKSRRLDSAEEWLAYLLRGEVTEEDHAGLETWLAERPENRAEFELLRRGWQLSGHLEIDLEPIVSAPVDSDSGRLGPSWRGGLMIAAALVSVVVGGLWVISSQTHVLQHRTAQGEQRTVALADGSRIRLNTATTLNVAANEEEVQLLEGEAFFDVQAQSSGHFSVDAGAGKIRVLGTRFNVLREGGDVVISVLEGQVAVEARDRAGSEGSSHMLSVGQTLEIKDTQRPRLLADSPDLARVRAWQEGKVEFDHTPLHEAVRELSRYTPETLSLAESSLAALQVSGVFRIERLGDLDSVRFALENTLPVTFRSTGDALELIPSDG